MCACVLGLRLKRLCLRQVFREHAIDGETLPLLTEEHLLSTMGLKLGPALKIRSQVHTLPSCVCVCVRSSGLGSGRCVCVLERVFLSVGP